jgi:hypothetical protein
MQSGYSSRVTGRKSGEGFRVGNYVSTSFATQDECARFSAGNDLSRTDHNLLTRSGCIISDQISSTLAKLEPYKVFVDH